MEHSARILLVDDEPLVLEMFESLLTNEGYSVSGAQSADEACSLIDHYAFDALICDVRLEGITGFEVAQIFKAEQPQSAVVLITGAPQEKDRIIASDLGYGYLAKPVRIDLLLRELKIQSMPQLRGRANVR